MHPFLIDFGLVDLPLFGPTRLALPTYGLLVATAIVVAWLWMQRNAKAAGLDPDQAGNAAFWAIVGGIVGGKVGLVVVEAPTLLANPGALLSADFLQSAGLVWTAVLGGALALVLAARAGAVPILPLLDATAVTLPVAQAIGRLGCLFAGCCYGGRCELPWAIHYHSEEAHARTGVPLGVGLHPAPLYEAAWNLAVALPVLLWISKRSGRRPGDVVFAYFALYGVGRFMVEFFRGDEIRGLWFGGSISTSQLLSLAIAPVAVGLWLWRRRTA